MMSDPSAIKILPTKKDIDEYLSEVADFMKLNYNCPDSEKTGSGKGSCGGNTTNDSKSTKKYTKDDLTFETGGDANGQQYDGFIIARDKKTGKKLGYVDYSYLDGDNAIQMIETNDKYKRMGIASALIEKLREMDPGSTLSMQGNFATKEGKAFLKTIKLDTKTVPVSKVLYNPGLAAVAINRGDKIEVGKQFFEGDRSNREYVIAHELAHTVADIATEKQSKEYGYAKTFDNDVQQLTTEVVINDDGSQTRIFAFEMTRLEEAKTEVLTAYAQNKDDLRDKYGDLVVDWAKQQYDAANVNPDDMIEQANKFVDALEMEHIG